MNYHSRGKITFCFYSVVGKQNAKGALYFTKNEKHETKTRSEHFQMEKRTEIQVNACAGYMECLRCFALFNGYWGMGNSYGPVTRIAPPPTNHSGAGQLSPTGVLRLYIIHLTRTITSKCMLQGRVQLLGILVAWWPTFVMMSHCASNSPVRLIATPWWGLRGLPSPLIFMILRGIKAQLITFHSRGLGVRGASIVPFLTSTPTYIAYGVPFMV